MSSQALLTVSEIANGNSTTKNEDVLAVLVSQDPTDLTMVSNYINAVNKQQTLPVKTILGAYIDRLSQLTLTIAQKKQLFECIIALLTPPTASVSIALTKTVFTLVSIYESSQLYSSAIETLKILNTDVIIQDFQDVEELNTFRVGLNIRIAKNCLDCHDYESAESHLTRIAPLLGGMRDATLVEKVHEMSVRVMVRLEKWLEAASRLVLLDEEQHDPATVLYSILVSHSQFKKNLFDKVMGSDHIVKNLAGSAIFDVFGKMHEERLIYASELADVFTFIQQRPSLDFGDSPEILTQALRTAVVESNLVSASSIFENITLESFAGMLELDVDEVQDIVADMVRSGRIRALVDDVSNVISFAHHGSSALKDWEDHVTGSCTILDKIVGDILYEQVTAAN